MYRRPSAVRAERLIPLNHSPDMDHDPVRANGGMSSLEQGEVSARVVDEGERWHRVEIGEEERQHIERFARGVAVAVIVVIVLIVIGILTIPRWITLLSHESERRFVEPYVGWLSDLALDPVHPDVEAYVKELGADVAAEMELPAGLELEIHVIEGDEVNAFATLGGHIFVLEGLIEQLDNENSLAMVLGHEIAHAARRDPLTSLSRGLLLQLLLSTATGDTSTSRDLGGQLVLTAYSRELEETADELALAALHRLYGHVGGATTLFEDLRELEVFAPGTLLATHPDLSSRIQAIEDRCAARGWTVEATASYPDAVLEGLSSGP